MENSYIVLYILVVSSFTTSNTVCLNKKGFANYLPSWQALISPKEFLELRESDTLN